MSAPNPIPRKTRRMWAEQALDRLLRSVSTDEVRQIPIKMLAERVGVNRDTLRLMLAKRGVEPPPPGRTWMHMIDSPQPGDHPTRRLCGCRRTSPKGGCE